MQQNERDRLAKVLGMVGSHHDGEVLAAGRMAHALLRAANMTWPPQLLGVSTLVAPPTSVWRESHYKGDILDLCADWEHVLTPWERCGNTTWIICRRVGGVLLRTFANVTPRCLPNTNEVLRLASPCVSPLEREPIERQIRWRDKS